jgi:hypothetical protein
MDEDRITWSNNLPFRLFLYPVLEETLQTEYDKES